MNFKKDKFFERNKIINKKTNKEKVLNFVQRLGRSCRAKRLQNFLQST